MLFRYLPNLNIFLPQEAEQIGNLVIAFIPKKCYFMLNPQAKLQWINDAKYMDIYNLDFILSNEWWRYWISVSWWNELEMNFPCAEVSVWNVFHRLMHTCSPDAYVVWEGSRTCRKWSLVGGCSTSLWQALWFYNLAPFLFFSLLLPDHRCNVNWRACCSCHSPWSAVFPLEMWDKNKPILP